MSSISKAGIFIDVKQLLDFTYRVTGDFQDTERNRQLGHQLIQYNLDMISNFTMAYHRRDEHMSFEAGGKMYDINLKGEKRQYVDALEASFNNYMALMEFCFAALDFTVSARKRKRRHKHFMELMAKLSTGIAKWSGSIYKQIVVSEK